MDHYEPDRGSNHATFGFDVYHGAVHALRREADHAASSDPGFRVESEVPLFRLRVGDLEVGTYRVGGDADDDIRRSFPANERGAGSAVEKQLWLPGVPDPLSLVTRGILAHVGNVDSGLLAVYFCVPRSERAGRIVEWAEVCCLWKSPDLAEDLLPAPRAAELVPDEVVEEAPIRRLETREIADGSTE